MAAWYTVLIEAPLEKCNLTGKVFAPVVYVFKTINPAQFKKSNYDEDFLAIFFAFKKFG